MDAVEGGASVSFLLPFTRTDAQASWQEVLQAVAAGETVLWGAWLGGRLVGTVQLVPSPKANQRHRADVARLLVHSAARRQGVGRALMEDLEREARARGRTLLMLDTRAGDASEALYQAMGWVRFGVVPRMARGTHGPLEDCAFYYKELAAP